MSSITGRIASLLCAAALLATACGGAATSSSKQGASADLAPYVVGFDSSLSGSVAEPGTTTLDGLTAFINWRNANGGVNRHPVHIVTRDDRLQTSLVSQNFAEFRDSVKPSAVVGYNVSSTASAIIADANAAKIPILVQSPGSDVVSTPFGYGVQPSQVVTGLAEVGYITKHAKAGSAPKVAWVSNLTTGAEEARKAGVAYAQAKGLNVVDQETFSPSPLPTDLGPMASKIIKSGAEWVFGIPGLVTLPLWRALAQQGWQGRMLNFQLQLSYFTDINSPNYLMVGAFRYPDDPAASFYVDAVKKEGGNVNGSSTTVGWSYGELIAKAFERCGFPCSGSQMQAALDATTDAGNLHGLALGGAGFSAKKHSAPNVMAIVNYTGGKTHVLDTLKIADLNP